MDRNGVIGKENDLPWRLPADLRNFRRITLGKPIVVGRRTFESIGRPLDGRTNIILTRDRNYHAEGCRIAHTVEEALQLAEEADEVMVIGGAAVYAGFMPRAGRIYLTEVQGSFAGDTWFPPFDRGEWREIERREHPADEKSPHPFSFVVLER